MSPGVYVLSLTHFGTPKLCSLWLHIEVEQGYMWPTAGSFTCDGTLPAAQTWLLTKSINRCVLTWFQKQPVMSQDIARVNCLNFPELYLLILNVSNYVSPSSIWKRKEVILLITLKIKYYFNKNMETKPRQTQNWRKHLCQHKNKERPKQGVI